MCHKFSASCYYKFGICPTSYLQLDEIDVNSMETLRTFFWFNNYDKKQSERIIEHIHQNGNNTHT